MKILGIDPGAKGALALVDGHSVKLFEMPRVSVRRGKTDKDEVDGFALMDILSDLSPDVAYIELVGGMDGQSASAAFNFGRAAGAAEYLLMGLRIRHVRVPPTVWKPVFKIRGGKDDARMHAMRLWPEAAAEFRRRRMDFAEAALIAEYGRLQERDYNVFD